MLTEQNAAWRNQWLKDGLVTSLVVGSFLVGAIALFAELRDPWPAAEPASVEMVQVPVSTYFINATRPSAP
jgi:hypothetical protein